MLPVVLASAQARASARDAEARAVDAYVRAEMDSGFRGVVLVARGDSVLLHRAYTRGRSALGRETAFWIASNTVR